MIEEAANALRIQIPDTDHMIALSGGRVVNEEIPTPKVRRT